MMDYVPQQNAKPLLGRHNNVKKKRFSSGNTSAIVKLLLIGSGLKKYCGVCTTALFRSRNKHRARKRKLLNGINSASKTATTFGASLGKINIEEHDLCSRLA